MPFGLQGAPATFQRLMDGVIQGLGDFSAAYLDDLIVFSETFEEHLHQLRKVLQRLREAGLTAKAKKCLFGADHCVYLGHIVGGGVVCPELTKLSAVEQFPVPTTKRQVRIFLGLTGYYRRFIPHYSSIATPLTDLTRKTAPTMVVWSKTCVSSFKKLKELLCTMPVLSSPDFEREFILQTDASDRGIGAVLSQCDVVAKNTQWPSTVRNSCPEKNDTQQLRRSVWLLSYELKHSESTCWANRSWYRQTTEPWSGWTD